LAKVTLEAHTLGDLECRNDAPLDLLARLSGSFACSTILPPGLIELRNKSVACDGVPIEAGSAFRGLSRFLYLLN